MLTRLVPVAPIDVCLAGHGAEPRPYPPRLRGAWA